MEPKLQRRIQRYGWDKAAGYYERFWMQQLAPAQQRMLSLAGLSPGEKVLDVACGTGLVALPAAAAVHPGGELAGTDISQNMVEAARAKAGEEGVGNARFLRMDAERLEFHNECFDVALCALGLMYFPNPVDSLREMYRVLKPGGRASAVVWGERSRCGWAAIFPIVDARVESEVCPMFFQLGTGANLEHAFSAAGFRGVRTECLRVPLRYDSAEEACGAAFEGGPVALAYSRFDAQTRTEAHAEYLASIEGFRNCSGYNIPGEFVAAVGYKQ